MTNPLNPTLPTTPLSKQNTAAEQNPANPVAETKSAIRKETRARRRKSGSERRRRRPRANWRGERGGESEVGEERRAREMEKMRFEAWKTRKVRRKEAEKRKRLKKRKMAVEGIDCQMRKAAKRWLTTASGAGGEGIFFFF